MAKKSETEEEWFDPYNAEVLAANGLEYDPSTVRMRIKWWAYRVQLDGNLSADQMIAPPIGVIRHLDLMEKCWGWWRLLPMYRCAGVDLPLYKEYLCEYYVRNPPESVDAAAASTDERLVVAAVKRSAWTNENGRLIPFAYMCLGVEDMFRFECERVAPGLTDGEIDLSDKIKLRAREIIHGDGGGGYVGAYAAAAALVCIAKEAELMKEWVIHGQYRSSDPNCILSNQIREHALSLMMHRRSGSVAATAGAAMMGAAKEAKLLCECVRQDLTCGVALCDEIREEAHAVLLDLCKEVSSSAAAASGKKEKKKQRDSKLGETRDKSASEANGSQGGTPPQNTHGTTGRIDLTATANLDKVDCQKDTAAPVSRINNVGKKEKKEHRDSKLSEKGDKRASAEPQNTHANTGSRDLTATANLDKEGRQKDTAAPVRERAREAAEVTREMKIDMILTMLTGMASDIAVIDERQKKMWRRQESDIGRDKNIDTEASVGALLSAARSELGDLHITTPLDGSPRGSDDTGFSTVDFYFGKDDRPTQPASSSSVTAAPPSRQTYASASAPSATGVNVDTDEWIWVT